MKLDALFINPSSGKEVYQALAKDYSGVGTPYWALLLAQSCRARGFQVAILDVLAERLAIGEAVERIIGKLREEIERDMILMGVNNIDQLSKKNLKFR